MQYVTTAERIGIRKGWQQGHQGGEARILLRLVTLKVRPPSDAVRERIETADAETLLAWSERILTAQCLDDVLREFGSV